ncbi:hypothetical protein BH24ACT11_BH24ACT11_19700 [soil metagenome]
MSDALQDKTVAFAVASDGIEQVELTEPWQALSAFCAAIVDATRGA